MMEQKSKVLVVEDDTGIRQSLFETLGALGFAVGEASNGEEALLRLRMVDYNAVLLDIAMPGMGGKEACRRIHRSYPQIPVVMLTVRDGEDDVVESLELGASDYVTKPFQIRELTARLRAVLRRHQALSAGPSAGPVTVFAVGDLSLDIAHRRVEKRGKEIILAPKEFETLRCLIENAGRPVPHQHLLKSVWGPHYSGEREYLRTIINQLRKKLEDDRTRPVYILTESHIGYRFRENDE
jgi:two-component system KDP operon response regulator KdpE